MAVADQPPVTPAGPGGFWPSPEQFRQFAPFVRLLTSIWSVPQVRKVSTSTCDSGVDLWVFMTEDNYQAEALISRAERDFLNSSDVAARFHLHVIPGNDVDPEMLPPTILILER